MSWLPVAVIPTLLMLATIGLERIETGLDHALGAAAEVTAFFEHVEADAANLRFHPTQQADRV